MPTLIRRKPERPTIKNNVDVYRSYRWRKFSKAFLKANPLCVECLRAGRTERSRATDHRIPIEAGGDIWNTNNLDPLCFSHHSQKTRRENKGYND